MPQGGKISYDIAESDKDKPGVISDYDVADNFSDNMTKIDELAKGKTIYDLANIQSRLQYDEIVGLIGEEPSFLRLRALYYLWRVEPEQFYVKLRQLAQPVGGKILVSNDNLEMGKIFELVLGRHGFTCIYESSPLKTLEILEDDNNIALLVTDILKPQMDGIQMINQFRAIPRAKYLPVIIASASGFNLEASRDSKPIEIDLYMPMPFLIKEFLNGVKILLLRDYEGLEQHFRASGVNSVFKFLREST